MSTHSSPRPLPSPPPPAQDELEQSRGMMRRGSFVVHCAGYGCGTALYAGDVVVRCALGVYCQRCWGEIHADIRIERELGHDHA